MALSYIQRIVATAVADNPHARCEATIFPDLAVASPPIDIPQNTPKGIMWAACERHGITFEMLTGRDRRTSFVVAREECAHRMRDELHMTYEAIGRRLRRETSTVRQYALRQR